MARLALAIRGVPSYPEPEAAQLPVCLQPLQSSGMEPGNGDGMPEVCEFLFFSVFPNESCDISFDPRFALLYRGFLHV